MKSIHARHIGAVLTLVLLFACGGGSPTGPSGGGAGSGGSGGDGGSGGGSGTSGATITIGANGAVSPAAVTINTGQSVTFVNNSSRTRNVWSDPHPVHTDCPPINAVNLLAPGQTKTTNAFTTARTCGFHDHDNPDDAGLRGSITIR